MLPTEIVKLSSLMERTSGNPEIKIGLIDGPVVTRHTILQQSISARLPEIMAPARRLTPLLSCGRSFRLQPRHRSNSLSFEPLHHAVRSFRLC